MSHFTTVHVEVNDLDAVRTALDAMQLAWRNQGSVQNYYGSKQPVELGVQIGDRWRAGFVVRDDGIDLVGDFFGAPMREEEFLARFRVEYGRAKVEKEARARGFQVIGEQVRDTGEVVLTLRRYV